MAVTLFAAINVGSFELELCIYEISSKYGIRQIEHIRHVIALGKDTYTHGKISYELVNEMCQVLKQFKEVMNAYQTVSYRAYATSAMREARNNQIVLDQIKVQTGIKVKIISNSQQRFLSYKAIASKDTEFHTIIQKGTAIADVGFGSMQISLFDKDALVSTQNLMLGVIRLQEIIANVTVDREAQIAVLEELVDNELFTFRKMYLKDREIKNLIGIGENMIYLSRGMAEKHMTDKIPASEFYEFYQYLSELTLEQIEDVFGVSSKQACMLFPAAIIYKRVLELTGAEMLWVPPIRLCSGIAASYAEDLGTVQFNHDFTEDIIGASRNMAKRYKCHTSHALMVEKYVLEIFDCLKKYHGMGKRERILLRIAAILHDCGKFVEMKNPGDCAYNIIISTEIIGLSDLERQIIAYTVKYNVNEFDYNQIHLNPDVLILIGKLTAILRLSNSMDRSHKQKLKDSRLKLKDKILMITAGYPEDISLEILSFEGKADFFEEIFGIRPVLKHKRRLS